MNKQISVGKFDQQTFKKKFDQKCFAASLKKGIVVCLLTAALLISMVGMASAQTITWRMTNTASGVDGAQYIMYKYSGAGSAELISIGEGVSKVWSANASALVDCSFTAGTWVVTIDMTADHPLDTTDEIVVEIGYLKSGTFYPAGSRTYSPSVLKEYDQIDVTVGAFTVETGDYLVTKITMNKGDIEVETNGGTNSDSYTRYPYGTPDYPVPELPTIVLMSAGLLALAGFVLYNSRSRRRNNKSE